jgi:hypothetical protein
VLLAQHPTTNLAMGAFAQASVTIRHGGISKVSGLVAEGSKGIIIRITCAN